MTEPVNVWIVRTAINGLHGWFYVGVENEEEARQITTEKRDGEHIVGAKRVRNVDHVKNGEFRPVPIGDYWGPLIPE
jgi:hypothetical protein